MGRFPACIESDARRSEARWDNLAVCCWLAAAVAMTVAFPRAVLFVYWLPMLFYASAAIVVSLPEHYGLAGLDGVARNTRSIRSNRVVRFVLWNANYHAEHHAFPSIPTVHLHRVHEAAAGAFEHQERSYFGFHLALLRRLLAGAGRDAEK
jgi:fatty acid desaturase